MNFLLGVETTFKKKRFMVLTDSTAGMNQQPCYSSYINLKNVSMSSVASNVPTPLEDPLEYKLVLRRNQMFVFGCKHFPEVEISAKNNWACEFCDGAKLIEQASRSNAAVSSLDIDKLLVRHHI